MKKRQIQIVFISTLLLFGLIDAIFIETFPSQITKKQDVKQVQERIIPTTIHRPIEEVLQTLQATHAPATEQTILEQLLTEETFIKHTILKEDTRQGLITWIESSDVKEYMNILKEALHTSFSAGVRDVLDETQKREGYPVRTLISFIDPALSEERLLFLRVRDRLYEFHIADESDALIFDLVEELSK